MILIEGRLGPALVVRCELRIGEGDKGQGRTYSAHYFHICGTGAIARRDSVDDPEDVALHHAHKFNVVFALGCVAEVFDEVHYVCAVVHGVLLSVSASVALLSVL